MYIRFSIFLQRKIDQYFSPIRTYYTHNWDMHIFLYAPTFATTWRPSENSFISGTKSFIDQPVNDRVESGIGVPEPSGQEK